MLETTDTTGRRRVWAAVLTILIVAGTTAGVATAAPAAITVSGMSVSDDEPTVGDTITVTPTIRHSSSGSGYVEVTQVTLEGADGTRYASADHLGTLGSGDTIDVPLSATLRTAGTQRLVVHIRGVHYREDGDNQWDDVVYIGQPTYVSVSEPSTSSPPTKPQVNVIADELTAGVESTVRVTVSNGGDSEVSNLSVDLSGTGTAEAETKLRPALGSYNSTTFEFDVRPPSAGTQQLNATLEYGSDNSVETTESVEVAPVRDDTAVYATLGERNGTPVLQYRVSNYGNAALSNVVLSGAAAGEPFPTTVIGSVAPGELATATVKLNERPSGPATVSAVYEVGMTTGQTDQTVRLAEPSSSDTTATSSNESSTASSTSEGTQDRLLPFGPLLLLVGGIAVGGSALGYRSWRRNGKP